MSASLITIRPFMGTWQYVHGAMVRLTALSFDNSKVKVRSYHGTEAWVPLTDIDLTDLKSV